MIPRRVRSDTTALHHGNWHEVPAFVRFRNYVARCGCRDLRTADAVRAREVETAYPAGVSSENALLSAWHGGWISGDRRGNT